MKEDNERLAEQKRIQDELVKARTMEAVGRLSAGIAHDFNNLITGIMGLAEEIRLALPAGSPIIADVDEIVVASHRASALTRQLLAFGRRQVAVPQIVNLNDLLTQMQPFLRRMMREDIEFELGLDPKVGNVRIDRTQMEQIVMNLFLNARDAIADKGRVSIETSNIELGEEYARRHVEVQPGAYVRLTVADNGAGMDEETLAHLFEPFFTTKETGKGVGLGLATVYGVVKQHGGDISVQSTEKRGSVFSVYLPRID